MDTKLDLKQIAMRARNAEYNPKVRQLLRCPSESLRRSRDCTDRRV
jgi:hypothetical protein